MNPFFYIDGDELRCELGPETLKIGRVSRDVIELYDVPYVRELYGDIGFTREILDRAHDFGVERDYAVFVSSARE